MSCRAFDWEREAEARRAEDGRGLIRYAHRCWDVSVRASRNGHLEWSAAIECAGDSAMDQARAIAFS